MVEEWKAITKLLAMILGNTAAIGFGIGLFEGQPVVAYLAAALAIIACYLEWRSEK